MSLNPWEENKKKKKPIKTMRGKKVIGTVSLKIFKRLRMVFFPY